LRFEELRKAWFFVILLWELKEVLTSRSGSRKATLTRRILPPRRSLRR